MKIALVSDLHLEFAPIKLPVTDAEVLLLAGDIVPFAYLAEHRTDAEARKVKKRMEAFIAESLGDYEQVFHIMGNHEYYNGVWDTTIDQFKEYWNTFAPQVQVLNNEAVSMDGFMLWGGTLWTDFSGGNPIYMEAARDGMNDYNRIYRPDSSAPYLSRNRLKLKPSDTQEEHENARYALKEELEKYPDDKWVVMTHHLPSWRSVHEKHNGSILNSSYASDMDQFIYDHPQIHTWVHGHTHVNWDYKIDNTRILCNPRGYAHPNKPNSPENTDFNPSFVFQA